jgi:hypothetical protein
VSILGLVLLNFLVWPSHPGYRKSPLNPYLAVVLLMAVRYGFRAGFMTGFLSAGVYLVSASRLEGRPLGPELIDTDLAGVAVVLLLSGALFGGFVQSLLERAQLFRNEADRAQETLARREKEIQELGPPKETRERPGVVGSPTLADVLDRIRKMRAMPDALVHQTLLDVLQFYFGVESAALYTLRDGELTLAASRDTHGAYRFPPRVSTQEGLTGYALRAGRVATTAELAGSLGGPFVISGPLRAPGGTALGLVAIRQIPFLRVNPSILRHLANLLEWTAECLGDPRRAEGGRPDLSAATRRDPLARSFLAFYLEAALVQARDEETRCALFLFRIGGYHDLPPDGRLALRRVTTKILLSSIRAYDYLCDTDEEDLLAMVLVAPKVDCTDAVLQRVRQAWHTERASSDHVPAELSCNAIFLPPVPDSVEALLAQVKKDLALLALLEAA